jgi:hypothetical protein
MNGRTITLRWLIQQVNGLSDGDGYSPLDNPEKVLARSLTHSLTHSLTRSLSFHPLSLHVFRFA